MTIFGRFGTAARRRVLPLGVAAAVALGAAAGGVALAQFDTPAAQALADNHGPGIDWGNGIHSNGAGAFIIDGKNVYCAEIGMYVGATMPTYVGSGTIRANPLIGVRETSGDNLRQIGYIIAKYGQTEDDAQAAAVGLAVWTVRANDGDGSPDFADYLRYLDATRAIVGPSVVAWTDAMIAEAREWIAAGGETGANTGAGGSLGVSTDPRDPFAGAVSVPAGTLTLTIAHGTFSDGTTSREWPQGAPAGTSLSWRGTPSHDAGWDRYYSVSFSGNRRVLPASILVGDRGEQVQLTVAAPAEETQPLQGEAHPDTAWRPQVSSRVASTHISVGEPFTDTITFSPAPASSTDTDTDTATPPPPLIALGSVNGQWRWRQNAAGQREWMPVRATGTVYGPFLSDPALNPQADAPVGAPVAARIAVTTDPARDHSTPQTYEVTTSEVAQEQGYYTFKWDINGADQDAALSGFDDCTSPSSGRGCRVLPSDYFYSDGFGAARETQIGRMTAAFTTVLSSHELGLGDTFTDEVRLPDMPSWLRDADGKRIPLTLTGTVYLSKDADLVQSVEVPADATPLATLHVSTDPALNGQTLSSDAARLPLPTGPEYRHVTVRWCILDADQQTAARGFWEERCDDYGVPEESARIDWPTVTTEAQELATTVDAVTDTAIVSGRVPPRATVSFEVFKQIEAGDAKRNPDGSPSDVSWSADEVAALGEDAVCQAENRVASTSGVPVQAGPQSGARYASPGVTLDADGEYWWVETLTVDSPEDGRVVLHRGECGLPGETTVIATPRVSTSAVAEVTLGERAHDVAFVTGPVPRPESGVRAELTFEAFTAGEAGAAGAAGPSDGDSSGGSAGAIANRDETVCTDASRVVALGTGLVVTGADTYESDEVTFDEPGDHYWVETLSYVWENGERQVIHRGECGIAQETTSVTPPPVLASTGASLDSLHRTVLLAAAMTGAGIIMTGVWLVRARMRRRARH